MQQDISTNTPIFSSWKETDNTCKISKLHKGTQTCIHRTVKNFKNSALQHRRDTIFYFSIKKRFRGVNEFYCHYPGTECSGSYISFLFEQIGISKNLAFYCLQNTRALQNRFGMNQQDSFPNPPNSCWKTVTEKPSYLSHKIRRHFKLQLHCIFFVEVVLHSSSPT